MNRPPHPRRHADRSVPPPDGQDCQALGASLRALEQGRAGAAPASLAALRRHLAACATCRARHGSRLAALEGLLALRERDVPDGFLDGLADAVEARTAHAPAGGGMSLAFLDAPRALRVWRTTALAASLLLAVGVGLVASVGLGGGDGAAAGRERVIEDPRPALLPTAAGERPSREGGLHLWPQPVLGGADGSGDARFFEPAVPAAVPVGTEPTPRWN